VVKKSSNVGSANIALSLIKRNYGNVFNQLGFGEKTDIWVFPGKWRGKCVITKLGVQLEQRTNVLMGRYQW